MNPHSSRSKIVGRGSALNPPNRFEHVRIEDDLEQLDPADETSDAWRVPTVFLPNESRRIIAENDSPDVGFRYSINPYRGCEHGCAYCYAQPKSTQHENRAFLLISALKWRFGPRFRLFTPRTR